MAVARLNLAVAGTKRQMGSSLDLAHTSMGLVEGEHQQGQKMDHTMTTGEDLWWQQVDGLQWHLDVNGRDQDELCDGRNRSEDKGRHGCLVVQRSAS
jgi:hypothetical protein